MKFLILIALSLFGLVNTVTVNIQGLGKVEGKINKTQWTQRKIYEFMGIRYAKSPSGSRRFMAPEPIGPWSGTLNASKMGIACPQVTDLRLGASNVDIEDCLTLNVYTPQLPGVGKKLLPVMFYIHGGAFIGGSAAPFKPGYLLEHDIVLVTIQYRLGPLGFLSLNTEGIPGNAALIDQVEALRWVNKHINNFGGDKNQVTVFGESAGAGASNFLLLSPIVQPYLFQKIIIQSGASYAKWGFEKKPLKVAKNLYKQLTGNAKEVDISTMERTFKTASVKDLFEAANNNKMDNGLASRPVAQTAGKIKFFTKSPDKYLESGQYRALPMMIGVTKHEGTFLLLDIYNEVLKKGLINDDTFLRNNLTRMALASQFIEITEDSDTLVSILNEMIFGNLFHLNKALKFSQMAPGITDILGMFVIKGNVLKAAKVNSKYNSDTFFYSFDYKGQYSIFNPQKPVPFDIGVAHGDDLIYLFPLYQLNSKDTSMAKFMVELWTSFAIGKKPKSSTLRFDWPKFKTNENGPYVHLNMPPTLGTDFVHNEFMTMSKDKNWI